MFQFPKSQNTILLPFGDLWQQKYCRKSFNISDFLSSNFQDFKLVVITAPQNRALCLTQPFSISSKNYMTPIFHITFVKCRNTMFANELALGEEAGFKAQLSISTDLKEVRSSEIARHSAYRNTHGSVLPYLQ